MNWEDIEAGDVLVQRSVDSSLWFYYIVIEKPYRSDYVDCRGMVLCSTEKFSFFSCSAVAAIDPTETNKDGTPKFLLLKHERLEESYA